MPHRSKLSLEALRSAGNLPFAHCNEILSPAEYLRLDEKQLRCGNCGKDFVSPRKDGPPMRTSQ